MKWTWQRLWKVLKSLPEVEDGIQVTTSPYGTGYRHGEYGVRVGRAQPKACSESVMHEIFHMLLLGRPLMTSIKLGDAIRALDPRDADDNELRTLAAEVVFFQRLGMQVEVETLVDYAFHLLQSYEVEGDGADAARAEVTEEVFELMYDEQVLGAVDTALRLVGAAPPT